MKSAVLDASILVKLFFEEDHSTAAEQCVRDVPQLLAPDLVWSEVANVIWKRHRRGDLSAEDSAEMTSWMLGLPLNIWPSADLIPDALDLAMQFDRTVYDSLYVALAVRASSVMLTGDKRLVNSLEGTPLEKYIAWIGNYR